jgi:hypothetical protein
MQVVQHSQSQVSQPVQKKQNLQTNQIQILLNQQQKGEKRDTSQQNS